MHEFHPRTTLGDGPSSRQFSEECIPESPRPLAKALTCLLAADFALMPHHSMSLLVRFMASDAYVPTGW